MEVLIFIVVIVVLIVVHELGHFFVAKFFGIRVDEFGLGYPPRAALLGTIGETEYTLNWLPFGGFVKIFGEDGEANDPRSFVRKPRIVQALVLVAGILMNLVFAYLLLTCALALGTPRALMPSEIAHAKDLQLAVADILPASPAAKAGIEAGDEITNAALSSGSSWHSYDPASFSNFVAASNGAPLTLTIDRNNAPMTLTAVPAQGINTSEPTRYTLGVEVATIGVVPLSFSQAIIQGATLTYGATIETAAGLAHFFAGVFTFHADLSEVTGPVGIAGAVGGAATAQGFGDLLSLVALISINLALINLIPVPALDGGRLLFVIIEAIIRRPIKVEVANAVNSVGFALLILLMLVVTIHDIFKLVA